MFRALEFAIQRAENNYGLDEDLREDLRFDLAKCKLHIYSYKFSVIRSHNQNHWWQEMQQNGPASTAFLQCDYAMKVRKHVTESTYFLKMLVPPIPKDQ